MNYTGFDSYMKQRFGGKVYRLALSTGCTCPNRDGKCGHGGCIFCSSGGSGEFAAHAGSRHDIPSGGTPGIHDPDAVIDSVNRQIEEAKTRVAAKLSHNFAGYMAYFQSFTNTYFRDDKEFEDVKAMFSAAAKHPEVLAVSIATRPDCLPHKVIEMLAELNRVKPVMVELGLQTVHDETALLINRGYRTSVYDDAVKELHNAGIGVVTHMIVGLPGETPEMMDDTVRHIVSLSSCLGQTHVSFPDGIKIQILQILKGTVLAELRENGMLHVRDYSLPEYASVLRRLLFMIPEHMIIHRLTGDPPKDLLIAPLWSADKKRVLNTISNVLRD